MTIVNVSVKTRLMVQFRRNLARKTTDIRIGRERSNENVRPSLPIHESEYDVVVNNDIRIM